MKKFVILWRLAGGDEIFGWRYWTHYADSVEEAEKWMRKRFDELFLQCRREYKIYEVESWVSVKSYDTRQREAV